MQGATYHFIVYLWFPVDFFPFSLSYLVTNSFLCRFAKFSKIIICHFTIYYKLKLIPVFKKKSSTNIQYLQKFKL